MIRLTSALLVTTLITAPAFAGSASNSGSASHANAQVFVQMPDSSASSGSPASGGGDPTINYTGGYTVRNTPDVAVSSYAGAANSCGVGGSIGISGPGFGIGGSLARESEQCVKREWYKLMEITAEHVPSEAPAYRMWAAGIACSVDVVAFAAPPGYCEHPVAVAQAPVALAVTNVATVPAPAWCKRARPTTDASRAYVASVCGR